MSDPRSVTQWLELLRTGDENAARRLWDRYFRRLVQLARNRMGPLPRRVADEEDVALSVMDYLCRGAKHGRFDQVTGRDDLWRLLCTITAHKVVEKARHAGRQRRGPGRTRHDHGLGRDTEGGMDGIAGDEPTPDMLAAMDDEHRRLMVVLAEPSLQETASLRLEGWTSKEIADKLGITRRSVERKLQRIRLIWSVELTKIDHRHEVSGATE